MGLLWEKHNWTLLHMFRKMLICHVSLAGACVSLTLNIFDLHQICHTACPWNISQMRNNEIMPPENIYDHWSLCFTNLWSVDYRGKFAKWWRCKFLTNLFDICSKFETVICDKEFGSKIIKTLGIRCRLKIVHKWPQKVLQYSYISKKCYFEYACCYFGCFAPSHLKLEKLLRGVHFSFSIEDKIFCKKCLSQIGGCRPTWDESFQFSGLCNA